MILDDILVQAQNRRRPSRGLLVRMALWSRWGSINDQEMKMKRLRGLQQMKKHEPTPKKSKSYQSVTVWLQGGSGQKWNLLRYLVHWQDPGESYFWSYFTFTFSFPRSLLFFHFHFFTSSFSSLFLLSLFLFLVYWQDPGESLCRIIDFRSLNWTLMIAPFVWSLSPLAQTHECRNHDCQNWTP